MASKTLHSIVTGASRKGPSITASLINRLASAVHDHHKSYATQVAAGLYKGLGLAAAQERGQHYFTALHMFTVAIDALDPSMTQQPWDLAVKLSTVTDPSFVTLDMAGKQLLISIGDVNDDNRHANAVERAINRLTAQAHTYSNTGDMGQQHVAFLMLKTACGVVSDDEYELAHRLLRDKKVEVAQ